jgi:hypothetical protein
MVNKTEARTRTKTIQHIQKCNNRIPGIGIRMSPKNLACRIVGFSHVLVQQKPALREQGEMREQPWGCENPAENPAMHAD